MRSTVSYVAFFNTLENFVEGIDAATVKVAIGDSLGNSRVPSVNQMLRYFNRTGATRSQRLLGAQLQTVYDLLRQDIKVKRAISNRRTDAIDINELLNTYEDLVLQGSPLYRKSVSRALAA